MAGIDYSVLVGGVVSLLLTFIAYFLRLLIQDIRQISRDQIKLREHCVRLEAEQVIIRCLLEKRFKFRRSSVFLQPD